MPDLQSKGMQDPKWLRGYLSVKPSVNRLEDGGFLPPDQQREGTAATLNADQERMVAGMAQSMGKPVDEVVRNINEAAARKAVAPKF